MQIDQIDHQNKESLLGPHFGVKGSLPGPPGASRGDPFFGPELGEKCGQYNEIMLFPLPGRFGPSRWTRAGRHVCGLFRKACFRKTLR